MPLNDVLQDRRCFSASELRRILPFVFSDLSNRKIAEICNISPTSVGEIRRFKEHCGFELNTLMTQPDEQLLNLYYGKSDDDVPETTLNLTDTELAALKAIDSNINKVYDEYKKRTTQGGLNPLSRSCFYLRVRPIVERMQKEPDYYFAQQFIWGQQLQADFTGLVLSLNTPGGEVRCCILVAAWPKSYYVEARFVRAQTTTEACRVFDELFKKWNRTCSELVVDNAKCFVSRHNRSEAVINPAFDDFMRGYGVYVNPAPVRHAQTKSCAEFSVRLVQTLIAKNMQLFEPSRSIREHSRILQELIDKHINQGPFRKSATLTRQYLFSNMELPAAKPLPDKLPPIYSIIKDKRVPRDYMVELDGHKYSVPYTYCGNVLTCKVDVDTVSFWDGTECVARHQRSDEPGQTVNPRHEPPEKQEMDANKLKFPDADSIIKEAQRLDGKVAKFVMSRFTVGTGPNDRRCCIAVIHMFKKAKYRDLFGEACQSVLMRPQALWNSYTVNKLYCSVIREYEEKQSYAHQNDLFEDDGSGVYLHEPLASEPAKEDNSND